MTTKVDHLRALARVCRRWGGRLAIISEDKFYDLFDNPHRADQCSHEELSEAPFGHGHGLHWREKTVYALRGHERVGVIIHEMGHVFAAQHHPECFCGACHEWDWLGWEIALARQIDAWQAWSRHNANYGTDKGDYWWELSTKKRKTVVAESLKRARKIGVLDADDNPRSVR
jgi:hypothetical protein